ncbi:hypothetical protein SAMN00777080_3442 [Aquiflexum balticum DSM 16537]|uniref:HipA-like C-terminal domain-containing protein n=1 Tax=Aquiflexum balticum DSM 16537 TaxID=758820 RepID=A0A1W2H847_9BACT|nr:HipA domain-containing protein [Aquiflexum balticum]SMD44808.1 hypothetical protein SAMN00777080_3442 [Aquiflexum balticum DSM 16537]
MLRKEKSIEYSGVILKESKIPKLKEKNYYVLDYPLDGDAPKQFIKLYKFTKDSKIKKGNKKSWIPYIAKTAEKWYPHESIIEFAINKIGQTLGLKMNETDLVIANGQIRFLSKYFLNPREEKLVHGAEICSEFFGDTIEGERIANNKGEARSVFTFEFIKDALRNVFPNDFEMLMVEFVKMLVFDAIVGNNDRHFYNWGVIQNVRNTNKIITFAPIYDSARGLLWNFSEKNIEKHLGNYKAINGKKIEKYINGSKPRVSIDENKEANHFELVDFIKRYNNEFQKIVVSLSTSEMEDQVIKMLNEDIFIYFSKNRKELIEIVLHKRFEKIRNI